MRGGSILVVDDEVTNLDFLDMILGSEHSLLAAKTGTDAVAMASKHLPDVVVLDIKLPDIDGLEVCARLKANPATAAIPVVFVTSCEDVRMEANAFHAGAADFLVKPVFPSIVRARIRNQLTHSRTAMIERERTAALRMLGEAGHSNDCDCGFHTWRIAAYCKALAEALGWNADRAMLVEMAAPLHDIGQLGIPPSILRKPGPLEPDEREVLRTHCRIGWEMLSRTRSPLFLMASEIALHHHERWDGSGYPDGISGERIEESARVVALADVFDALSSKRPYKAPWPIERVVRAFREEESDRFDPLMVSAFLDILPRIKEIRTRSDELIATGPQPLNATDGGTARGA